MVSVHTHVELLTTSHELTCCTDLECAAQNPDESFFLGTMMALRIVPTASRCAGYN